MRLTNDVYARRRLKALGLLGGLALVIGALVGAGHGGGSASSGAGSASAAGDRKDDGKKPSELPRGGRTLFPEYRAVAFVGAPQDHALGALGIGSPDQAGAKLLKVARSYARKTRPVMPVFELIADVANRDPGPDGLYRTRQTDAVIRRYLRAARRAKALLLLDIQPGHADFLTETRHLNKWLKEPDVGLALDPEWHTPGAVPGTVIGSVQAADVNAVANHLATIVKINKLPQKLFVIHQFTPNMIVGKQQVVKEPGLATTVNVDGFGDRPNKISKYRQFTRDGSKFFNGFKLFYSEDTHLFSPGAAMALQPRPDMIVYE